MNPQKNPEDQIPNVTFAVYWGKTQNDPDEIDPNKMKYRLMREWQSTSGIGHLEYGQLMMQKDECVKHSKELGMTQKAYFEFVTQLFESVDYTLNSALIYSSEPSSSLGIRHFNVNHFLSRLASSKLYPGILVSKATISPFGLPSGNYQVLSEIRLILDQNYCFILPPYYRGEPQGNYDESEAIYLM